MALCMCESLLLCGEFNGWDQQQRYMRWFQDGHLSSTGVCFDIGKTTRKNLLDNIRAKRPLCSPDMMTDMASGNGSLMRLLPAVLYFAHDPSTALDMSALSSMTTHPSQIACDACRYFAALIIGALQGASKQELLCIGSSEGKLFVPDGVDPRYWEDVDNGMHPLRSEVLHVVQQRTFASKRPPEIKNGGFVVDALEAVLWAFHTFDSFQEGVLAITNLGDDSDTVACIYGQLAGVYYGMHGIPQMWVEKIALNAFISVCAEELHSQHVHIKSSPLDSNAPLQRKPSVHFTAIQELNDWLETEYAEIHRRMDPGPRMYRDVGSLEQDIAKFKDKYQAHITSELINLRTVDDGINVDRYCTAADRLLHDYIIRMEQQDLPLVRQRSQIRNPFRSGIHRHQDTQ